MKFQKTALALLFLLNAFYSADAQVSKADIFDRNAPVTWLGLDFTDAKFIGDREKYGSSSDVKFLLKSWNDLMEREYRKYNIAEAFRKTQVDIRVDIATAHNEELDVTEMLVSDKSESFSLKPEDIQEIVNSYDFKGLSGLGLMINIESFNKYEQKGAFWITFVDMGSKEVLLTERMVESAGGGGIRNYWAGSVNHGLEKLKGRLYESWRKKYGQ